LDPEDYMDKGHGNCDFSLMALDVPPPKGPLFIFGDPFLRRFVTIYDKNGPKVGFAVAKHGGMDEMKANQIIAKVDGQAQDGQSSSSAQASYDPKQVTMSLDSGMMMGEGQSSDDGESSSAPDPTTTTSTAPVVSDSTPATDSWASEAKDTAATAQATPAAETPAASNSGSNDIIQQFASGEVTSNDVFATSSTTTTAAASSDTVDYVKKYELGSESAPAASSTAAHTEKQGVLAVMNELLGTSSSSPDGAWIQQHAHGFKGKQHANRLVSIRLHKTETKKF